MSKLKFGIFAASAIKAFLKSFFSTTDAKIYNVDNESISTLAFEDTQTYPENGTVWTTVSRFNSVNIRKVSYGHSCRNWVLKHHLN
jgi:hypothetical protein